jgi:hypothetical protein
VYVFDEPVTGWADSSSYTQKLNASDASGATEFGFAVAIDADGDTMVIGAPFADVIHQDQGAAYVFERVPNIVIDDIVVTEGHSGATDAMFTLTRSEPLGENSVQYQTQDGTATTADGDYAAISGTVSFTGGEITRTITVTVCGDTVHEPDETFFVNLSDATHAVISDTQGVGTILNDDNAPPDDLTFSLAPNPLAEGSEITVTGSFTDLDNITHTVAFSATHTYADDGIYTLGVTVQDPPGASAHCTDTVTVTNVTPTLTLGGEASVDEGSVYTLTLSAVTDPGDDTVSACSLDWGDGSPTQDCLSHVGGTMQYTYADGDEVYTVTIDLTDEDGTYTSVNAHPVTVNNVAPALGPLADRSVTVGDVVTVTGIFTDAGTFDTYSVVIQWAQDVSETIGLAAGVREFCAVHTYTVSAEYTVTVTITDDDGGQDSDSFTVIVEPHYIYLPLVQRQAQGGATVAGGGADEFARRTPVPSSTSGRLRPGAAAHLGSLPLDGATHQGILASPLGEHNIGCLARWSQHGQKAARGTFRPTPEEPPPRWSVKDRLEMRRNSRHVVFVMPGKTNLGGLDVSRRLSLRTWQKATT